MPVNDEPGHGYPRYYDAAQVHRARTLRDLLDAGVSLQTCRRVIDQITYAGQVTVGHITFTYNPAGGDAA